MTDQERYKNYISNNCCNCKNKTTDLCEIRISKINGITTTKCNYYESDIIKKRKKTIKQVGCLTK